VVWGVEILEEVDVVECVLAAMDRGNGLREDLRVEVEDFCARDTANFACFARLRGAIVKRLYVDRFKVEGTDHLFVFFRGAIVGLTHGRGWLTKAVMCFRWNVWRRPGTREALLSP
jgi:hypothetical protein